VGFDVLTGDIRAKLLVTIRLTIKNQALFLFLLVVTVPLGPEEKAKFQGHVEPWKTRRFVGLGA
jgi:hypothetical protein